MLCPSALHTIAFYFDRSIWVGLDEKRYTMHSYIHFKMHCLIWQHSYDKNGNKLLVAICQRSGFCPFKTDIHSKVIELVELEWIKCCRWQFGSSAQTENCQTSHHSKLSVMCYCVKVNLKKKNRVSATFKNTFFCWERQVKKNVWIVDCKIS